MPSHEWRRKWGNKIDLAIMLAIVALAWVVPHWATMIVLFGAFFGFVYWAFRKLGSTVR